MEFGDLSRLTNDPKYLNASMKAYETILAKRSPLNLLGTNFDVEKGEFVGTDDVAPDEPVDSFYEYLWGGWQMLGIAQCRDWYRLLTDAILKFKVTHVDGNLWFKTVDYTTGLPTGDATTSELAAFYAELVSKGGNRAVGEAFYDSWTRVLKQYELIPEVIFYPDRSIIDPKYWLRPGVSERLIRPVVPDARPEISRNRVPVLHRASRQLPDAERLHGPHRHSHAPDDARRLLSGLLVFRKLQVFVLHVQRHDGSLRRRALLPEHGGQSDARAIEER